MRYIDCSIGAIAMEFTQPIIDHDLPAVSKSKNIKYSETDNIPAIRTNASSQAMG
jgi:hypothetical protein